MCRRLLGVADARVVLQTRRARTVVAAVTVLLSWWPAQWVSGVVLELAGRTRTMATAMVSLPDRLAARPCSPAAARWLCRRIAADEGARIGGDGRWSRNFVGRRASNGRHFGRRRGLSAPQRLRRRTGPAHIGGRCGIRLHESVRSRRVLRRRDGSGIGPPRRRHLLRHCDWRSVPGSYALDLNHSRSRRSFWDQVVIRDGRREGSDGQRARGGERCRRRREPCHQLGLQPDGSWSRRTEDQRPERDVAQVPIEPAEASALLTACRAALEVLLDLAALTVADESSYVLGEERAGGCAGSICRSVLRFGPEMLLQVGARESLPRPQQRRGDAVRCTAADGRDVAGTCVLDFREPQHLPEACRERIERLPHDFRLGDRRRRIVIWDASISVRGLGLDRSVRRFTPISTVDSVALVADAAQQVWQERSGRPTPSLQRRQDGGEDLGHDVIDLGGVREQRSGDTAGDRGMTLVQQRVGVTFAASRQVDEGCVCQIAWGGREKGDHRFYVCPHERILMHGRCGTLCCHRRAD